MEWETTIALVIILFYLQAGYRGYEDYQRVERTNSLTTIRKDFMQSIVVLSIGKQTLTQARSSGECSV